MERELSIVGEWRKHEMLSHEPAPVVSRRMIESSMCLILILTRRK